MDEGVLVGALEDAEAVGALALLPLDHDLLGVHVGYGAVLLGQDHRS